jgi:hypothetical protein|tara:strand:- start:2077 stop:2193 length:117 start_codon:yes stop_codon:yes gene_type:complete
MSDLAGWAFFLTLIGTNIAIYWAIEEGFETNFWSDDER